MKNLKFLLSTVFIVFAITMNSQFVDYSTIGKTIINEATLVYDGNPNPAVAVYFNGNQEDLKDIWQDFLKENYSVKLKRTGSIYLAPDASFIDITSKPVTLYSIINESSPDAGITIAMAFNNTDYISSENYPAEYEKLKSLLKRFIKHYQLNIVNEELSDIQKTYDDMAKDLEKLEKDKSDINNDIVKLEGDIFEAKSDIGKREKKIMELEAEIKELKTDIVETENEITEAKRLLGNSETDIQTQKEKVGIQKEKLEKLTAKKEAIISE